MSGQYFEIGEEIILASENRPELNGEYIIKDVMPPNRINYICTVTGSLMRANTDFFCYALDGLVFECRKTKNPSAFWHQSALRKKHKPSEESFSEIMSNLEVLNV